MDLSTPHLRYLTWADASVGIRGKHVLEIGGCSPVAEIRKFSPASWTCINLDDEAVAWFNEHALAANLPNYVATKKDAATIADNEKYAVVYSINSFEHISNLPRTLDGISAALAPGGSLFTVFGPIWSSDIGHHLSIPSDNGPIGMFDGVLAPWEHLTSSAHEIRQRLTPRLGAEIANRVVEYVFDYPDLNRMTESDYLRAMTACNLGRVLVLRNSAGSSPPGPPASTTREFLWILKKGPVSYYSRLRALAGFSLGFARTRLGRH